MNSLAGYRRSTRSTSGRACPAMSPRCASTKAPSSAVATCSSKSIRAPSRPRSIGFAPSSHARARRFSAQTRNSGGLTASARECHRERRTRSPRFLRAGICGAGGSPVEAALRAAELNLEFTQVTSPIDGRVGRAIVTEGNLVSSGPGEATLLTTVVSLDPVYAYFDADEQIFLRHRPRR